MTDCIKHKAAILAKQFWWLEIFNAKRQLNTCTVGPNMI